MLRGLAKGRPEALWAAGAAIGFTFLISPLAGGFCVAWAVVLALAARDLAVWRTVLAGAAVAAVWLVPLALDYHRYGGFVSITHIAPVLPSPGQTIVALGIVLPLGAAGALAIVRRPEGMSALAVALIVAVPAVACGGGALLGHGAEVLGTPALLRWSRYLPFLVLALAVPAGVAAQRLVELAGGPARAGGIAVAVAVAAVAVPSTVLATAAAVHHAYPRQLSCTQLPPAKSLTAVAVREPTADALALNLFSHSAASSVFLKIVHAKVRFRTWLQRTPTQQERHARYLALLGRGTLPPGVTWVVARPHAALGQSGLVPAGSCRLGARTFRLQGRRELILGVWARRRMRRFGAPTNHTPATAGARARGQQDSVVASAAAGAETLPVASTLSTENVRVTAQWSEPTVQVVAGVVRTSRPFTNTR